MRITERKLTDIIPYDKNPRINDEAAEYVANSIKEFGFKVPIIVDRHGVIVAGHTRLKAAERLGLKTAPVVVADDLTPEQVRAYRLADNKTAEMAKWDWKLLDEELAALEDLDMELFGFDDFIPIPDIDPAAFDPVEEEDAAEAETITKPGDLWLLGEHRLLCGDAGNPKDIQRLTQGRTIDLLLTDPPYNLDYTGKTEDALKIDNDRMTTGSFVSFITQTLTPIYTALKPGGAFYVWHAPSYTGAIYEGLDKIGADVKQNLIWVKQQFVMGRQDYHWMHESAIYGWKDGAGHYYIDDRTQTTVYDKTPHYPSMTKDQLIEHAKGLQEQLEAGSNILREDRPRASTEHPTMKPMALFERLIRNSSRPGETVADIFMGSGTTILAAERAGRRALGMEIDPEYTDVAVKRWETMTGQIATREPGPSGGN